jgi:hypothetical protein
MRQVRTTGARQRIDISDLDRVGRGDVLWGIEAANDDLAPVRVVDLGVVPRGFEARGAASFDGLAEGHGTRRLRVDAETNRASGPCRGLPAS